MKKHIAKIVWFRQHKWISLIIFLLLVVVFIFFRPKPPPEIPTEEVKQGKIVELLTSSGSIQAKESVSLSFLAGGKLSYVGVKKGSVVKKGQTIAIVDQKSAQINLQNSLIDYAKQRSTFEQTKSDNGGRSVQDALSDAMKRVLEDNQYDLEKAVNSVELYDLTKQNLALYSPIDGIVTRADAVTTGVNIGATTTYTIVNPKSLVFEIDVDETDIAKVDDGYEVQIILEAYPNDRIFTKVLSKDFASHKTDTGGNAYTVTASLPLSAKFDYLLGMNGDADIVLAKKVNAVIIPIVSLEDEKYVYVKNKNGYEKREVVTGLTSDTEIEVIKGVVEGEKVALQPEEASKQVVKKK
ncbi:MAG: efflux RND transporter periplasmic adaptor subunit [Candidatus Levybacteria bacterium]|nr:efflux RND transporter periplasmic adaptor subunit [Candidatus Levybacteria bacterium]